jgi:hypothetical protein
MSSIRENCFAANAKDMTVEKYGIVYFHKENSPRKKTTAGVSSGSIVGSICMFKTPFL